MKTILCIGNILMGDDGIGIILGHLLKKKGINCIICETDISLINEVINNSEQLIIVDAVNFDLNPGDIVIFNNFEFYSSPILQHDLVFYKNKKTTLFGIQVKDIDYRIGISSEILKNLKVYLNYIIKLYNSN
ncbi:hydrogenase maturation protease [Thermobrachium celere]|uniref:Hydrogenase maturation protease n=1 Tax=Thermobrachium celere DSM 8682 TaxID=941824 RepID=R7RQW0_9CLOT|nr:hydrogenase maturation protease [Thermobrachium celere]GFR34404.1 hypothetical protein TCEA9_02160 [Thermobrachium celere]CDF58572.1 hypothetical protein TCEL_00618 [Thermobrachium celere DSM 8682]